MTCVLANAEATDLSASGWTVIVIGLLVAGGVAILALLPMASARHGRHQHTGAIQALTLLWALLAGGSVLYIAAAELRWRKEWLVLVQSGYYDPQNTSGAPAWPWLFWIFLAAAYVALFAFSRGRKCPPPRDDQGSAER